MKVFVAGGTGNIGQNMTKTLLDHGHEVVVLTRTPDRVPGMIGVPGLTLVQGTVHDYDVIEKALVGCDAVIDFALNMKGRSPMDILESETKAVVFLLEAAEKAGVKKFLYTSTVAVMGPSTTEDSPNHPWGLYGATKASAEAYVLSFSEYFAGFAGKRDKKVTMNRNVIRPGETFSNPAFEGGASESYALIRDIVRKVYNNEDLTFNVNEGAQWAAGKQVCEVYRQVLESDCNEEIFLAVGSEFQSNASIAEIAKKLLPESTSKITVTGEPDPWPVRRTQKIKEFFGLEFTGKEYMEEHIAWLIDQFRREDAGEQLADTNHN